MITINDNSTNQINAAILRLNNNFTSANLELKNKLSSDVGRLELKIDEIKAGTLVYTAGSNISISSTGVISVTGLSTVATSGSYTDLTDKPTIPAPQVNADWNATSGLAEILNKPTIPAAQVQSDWTEADTSSKAYIQNKPPLAAVATSGSYNDLTDTPTIITPVQSDWTETDPDSLAYILNKPASQVVNDGVTTLYQGNSASRHLFGSWSANQSSANNVYIDEGFTYIVDSDAALQNWQQGTAGYDYTSVLIKKGTWTLNLSTAGHGIRLDTVGTKIVYGEPGSLIYVNYTTNVNSTEYVLYNTTEPTTTNINGNSTGIPAFINQYGQWVFNVSIEINDALTSNTSGSISAFRYVANLDHCSAYIHRNASTGGKASHYGFYYCHHLNQCQGNTSNSRQYGRPFSQCWYLTNCNSVSSAYQYGAGFYGCRYLSTCTGATKNLGNYGSVTDSVGFRSCYHMTSCYAYGSYNSGTALHGAGCYDCYYISACQAFGYAVGFSGCMRMTSCYASANTTSYPAVVNCRGVTQCRSNTGYQNSFASYSETATYACADTPNGGFNSTGS